MNKSLAKKNKSYKSRKKKIIDIQIRKNRSKKVPKFQFKEKHKNTKIQK